jgi:hypothetical protein
VAVTLPTGTTDQIPYATRPKTAAMPKGYVRFPHHSHGFLYCHIGSHNRDCEPYVSVRLRVTSDNSPLSFPRGEDLLVPSGFPWQISLVQLASRDNCAALAMQLVLENLVSAEQLSRCRRLLTWGNKRSTMTEYTLYGIHSLFLVHFEARLYFNVVAKSLHSVQVARIFSEQVPTLFNPWTGAFSIQLHRRRPVTLGNRIGGGAL